MASELNNFVFEIGLRFAFRDERFDNFVDDIGDTHTFSLRFLAEQSHRLLVKTSSAQRPAKTKGVTLPGRIFGLVFMPRLSSDLEFVQDIFM